MTVSELSEKMGLETLVPGDPTRRVTGGYTGDLLSWVMARANEGDAWITVLGSINVAVAVPDRGRLHNTFGGFGFGRGRPRKGEKRGLRYSAVPKPPSGWRSSLTAAGLNDRIFMSSEKYGKA